MTESQKIRASYYGECPDCGFEIPENVHNDDTCYHCGHVFYLSENDDEELRD
jgi:RNA polymerase-binding transcription factor DksA